MKYFEFHSAARGEYLSAVEYYNDAELGLGNAFVGEFENAIDLIQTYPSAWPPLGGHVRRCLLERFPYQIIYTELTDHVLILAVAHTKREPGYWRSREA